MQRDPAMYKRAVVGDSFDSSRSFRFQCFCLVFLLFELFKQHIQLVGNVIVVAEAVVKERRADGKAPGLMALTKFRRASFPMLPVTIIGAEICRANSMAITSGSPSQ